MNMMLTVKRAAKEVGMAREKGLHVRSDLRLADLKRRQRSRARLMNVKVPAEVGQAVEAVARQLGATKTEVVIALLNHGLDAATKALAERRARAADTPAPEATKANTKKRIQQ